MKLAITLIILLAVTAALTYAGLSYFKLNADGSSAEVAVVLTPEQQALKLAEERGCRACHSIDGSKGIGPSWLGAYGTVRQLNDGSSVMADEAYFRLAMQEPAAQVVAGFDNVMLPTQFTEEQITLMINMLRRLSENLAM